MGNWVKTIKIKHLLTEKEDHKSIQKSMNDIANVLDNSNLMPFFSTVKFKSIPKGDEFFKPVDYANKLLESLYDYADENRIWIS